MLDIVQITSQIYLECDLWGEDELVTLKQSPGGVHEHKVSDAVDEVLHPLFHIVGLLCTLYCIVEHHTEGLQKVQI